MIEKREWEEFRESGLFWLVNTFLHAFGWALVVESDGGKITGAYPARCHYRGFSEESNTDGYQKIQDTFLKEEWKDD